MPEEEKLEAVRAGLPATAAGLYLNTGSVGPLPAETAKAMADVTTWELNTGRAHPDYITETFVRMDEARAAVAAVLGATIDEIALTHATTDGMNLATWAADWGPGDVAVTTRHEHAGGLGGLYGVRERFGVQLRFVEPDPDGDDDRTLAAFDAAIVPGTRLVSVSHVLWTTGALLPVRRIAELALKHRLPMVSGISGFADAGGLMTYGAKQSELYRRAALFVDRILRGAKPSSLPIEQPASFELVINLKTAKALGLVIPDSLRLRADRLIE